MCIVFHCIILHYIALHCITLHYIESACALHCITLHYIVSACALHAYMCIADAMYHSLHSVVAALPNDLVVYPGHGYRY